MGLSAAETLIAGSCCESTSHPVNIDEPDTFLTLHLPGRVGALPQASQTQHFLSAGGAIRDARENYTRAKVSQR